MRVTILFQMILIAYTPYASASYDQIGCYGAFADDDGSSRPTVLGTTSRIPITGVDRYPTDKILSALGIDRSAVKALANKHPYPIASIGEGYSNLVPTMLSWGVDAIGIDLWYDSPISKEIDAPTRKKMLDYIAVNRKHLISGSALALPLPDNSTGLVLSHMVFPHLSKPEQFKSILEIIRVLRPGGEARVASFSKYVVQHIWEPLLVKLPVTFHFVETRYKEMDIPDSIDLSEEDAKTLQTLGYIRLIKEE